MTSKAFLLWLLYPTALNAQASQPSVWHQGPDAGWSWYRQAPKVAHQKKAIKEDSSKRKTPDDGYVWTHQMEKIRQDFEELQARAILSPTLENVQSFQRAQNVIMDRSGTFEKMWMLASLLSGENFSNSGQSSPKGRKIFEEQTEKNLEQQIHTLAKTYGLFFIFKNDCPYCHEIAPVIKQLQDAYQFAVKAISPDGQTLELFPDAAQDNGAIGKLNPEGIYPCVFLINPATGQTIPLARGLISLSEIRQNLKVIIQYLGERHAK